VRSAGILRHIAANRAGLLARGIGGIEELLILDRQRDVEIDDARLHHRAFVGEVEFEDAVHARERDNDPALARDRSAAQARARAAPHHRNAVIARQLHDRRDVARRPGKDDHVRAVLVHASVVFVQHQVLGAVEDASWTQQLHQPVFDSGRDHDASRRWLRAEARAAP
jgi:hypothetical protein